MEKKETVYTVTELDNLIADSDHLMEMAILEALVEETRKGEEN